ncbi:MAG: GspH/FimT family pseudopilin [Gammaproteobacteria bacterium]|nr:GspH/FimT family pseudopilin [Gammaproteobacteria bacterium]
MRRTHSGFTLVELMIVVVVLAVIATVAIPNLRTIIQKSEIKDTSGAITSSMMLARTEAVTQGRSITVCITSSTSCSTSGTWEEGWIVLEPTTNTVIRRVPAQAEAVGVTVSDAVGRVIYSRDGAADFQEVDGDDITSGVKTFTIANNCWTKDLDITATGRVDASTNMTPSGGC